jgi:hypothetical protein
MDEIEDPKDITQIADDMDELAIEDLEERYVQGKWNCSCSSSSCSCCCCCFYVF